MFGADVCQFLQVVVVGQELTEPLHRLIVAFLGSEAALAIVAKNLVQLGDEGLKDTGIVGFYGHAILLCS